MEQIGGVQATVQSTCVLDAYLNSILNSHKLCMYFITKYRDYMDFDSDIFSVIPSIIKHVWDSEKTPLYEYLIAKYIFLYFCNTSLNYRNGKLNDIRTRIAFLHNLGARIPKSLAYKDVLPMLESLYNTYLTLLEESEGENADIIEEMLKDTHQALYLSTKVSNPRLPESISPNITDIYIYYANDIMENANRINRHKMDMFNKIYEITQCDSLDQFHCTDMVLDQIEIGQPETEHSVYYNLLENNVQNEDRVSHIPFKDLIFKNCENIYDVVDKQLKKKCPVYRYKTINVGFYYPESKLGFYIPSVLHFQKVPKIHQEYMREGIINRLSLYTQILESQLTTTTTDEVIQKYRRYIEQLQKVINAFQNPSQDALKEIKSNPFSQLENMTMPTSKRVINIVKHLKEYFKSKSASNIIKLKEVIQISSSYITFNELYPDIVVS